MNYTYACLVGLGVSIAVLGCGTPTDEPAVLEETVVPIGSAIGDADRYLGMQPPTERPQVFAPGLISRADQHEFGSVFSEDGLALFYGVDLGGRSEIRQTVFTGGEWTPPRVLLGHSVYGFNDPFLSPQEDRLYFISNQPMDGRGEPKDIDIWYVVRQGTSWSAPINAGPEINSDRDEYYISFTAEGTLFFASNVAADAARSHDFDLYASRAVAQGFAPPERLRGAVNTPGYEADVFVAPDASYLIFSSARREGLGRGDLYVSFRRDDGTWGEGRNMGAPINTEGHELCPFVTRDGRYLFYTSNQDIYWVDAEVVEELR